MILFEAKMKPRLGQASRHASSTLVPGQPRDPKYLPRSLAGAESRSQVNQSGNTQEGMASLSKYLFFLVGNEI